jgi:hypothetical protein
MESTGKFLRPAQGGAVTAIDFVGGDSQPFCDDPAQPSRRCHLASPLQYNPQAG